MKKNNRRGAKPAGRKLTAAEWTDLKNRLDPNHVLTSAQLKKLYRQTRVASVKLSNMQPGPIQHARLDPLGEAWARSLYERVGHFIQPTFEQWELGFMRDINYVGEIIHWEAIARSSESYLREHPDCDRAKIVLELAVLQATPRPGERAGLRECFLQEREAMRGGACPRNVAELEAYLRREV